MMKQIVDNPYDLDRENFVELCKNKIQFMNKIDEKVIRELFYSCQYYFYSRDEVIFEVGSRCDGILIILNGHVNIQMTDGNNYHKTLDQLGSGSIIGQNFVLKQEHYPYRALNKNKMNCSILKISYQSIKHMMSRDKMAQEHIKNFTEAIDMNGLSQIDYIMRNDTFDSNQVIKYIKTFQRNLIWKAHNHSDSCLEKCLDEHEKTFDELLPTYNSIDVMYKIIQ